jgi:hypothetical protein
MKKVTKGGGVEAPGNAGKSMFDFEFVFKPGRLLTNPVLLETGKRIA